MLSDEIWSGTHDRPGYGEVERHMKWITAPLNDGIVRGALELEETPKGLLPHRLPERARRQNIDLQLAMAEIESSGVRLAFHTEATAIELETHRTKAGYPGLPPLPGGNYDLVVDGRLVERVTGSGGDEMIVNLSTGTSQILPGPAGIIRFADLPAGPKDVEIWLPFDEITRLVALRTTAPAVPPTEPRRRWVHHGSSISHGFSVAGPSVIWPALAATQGGVDLVNLGFNGNAMLDPFIARALRDTPADLLSVKIGANLVVADVMRLRAFGPAVHGFLDTIREGQPKTPLLVVSPLWCPIIEDTPGPAVPDLGTGTMLFRATGDPAERAAGKLTLSVIRDELSRIVTERATDDPNLHYLDGRTLYGKADFAEHPMPDALHPDTAAHCSIGERFAKHAFGADGPFDQVRDAGLRPLSS